VYSTYVTNFGRVFDLKSRVEQRYDGRSRREVDSNRRVRVRCDRRKQRRATEKRGWDFPFTDQREFGGTLKNCCAPCLSGYYLTFVPAEQTDLDFRTRGRTSLGGASKVLEQAVPAGAVGFLSAVLSCRVRSRPDRSDWLIGHHYHWVDWDLRPPLVHIALTQYLFLYI
jgi:hypothetical protein